MALPRLTLSPYAFGASRTGAASLLQHRGKGRVIRLGTLERAHNGDLRSAFMAYGSGAASRKPDTRATYAPLAHDMAVRILALEAILEA